MIFMADNSVSEKAPESSIPTPDTNHVDPPANTVLNQFLEAKNIELRLTPPTIRQIENGGLLIDQPQIVANYKQASSITPTAN